MIQTYPGPGVLVPLPDANMLAATLKPDGMQNRFVVPPVALILMCNALIPNSLHLTATSWAASMAAYGEDSSRSALTFIPPVTRVIVLAKTLVNYVLL